MAHDNFTAQEKYNNIIEARKHHKFPVQRRQVAYENLLRHLDAAKSDLIKYNELKKTYEAELKSKPSAHRGLFIQNRLPGLNMLIQNNKLDIARMEQEIATLEKRGAR